VRRAAQLLVLGGLLAAAPGRPAAHVAPSTRENNRYIVLAPLGDRLRLVYTVYMGEEPGRRARARMDRDHDRVVSEEEANAWADELADQVAAGARLEVDGVAVPLRWAEVDVGLGDPGAGAGAFAVDLVAWACFDRPRQVLDHRVSFRDRLALDDPGETELRAEESPGLLVTRSQLGPAPAAAGDRPRLDFKWMGASGPLGSGYQLEFKVDPALATYSDLPCPAGAGPAERAGRWPWLVFGGALFLVVGFFLARRLIPRTPAGQNTNG
jgi:hypothetical protein